MKKEVIILKGLILKDIMCLKKQLKQFLFLVIGVLIVSVMYVLSARFGNLALAGKEMLETNDMTSIDVKNLGSMVLVIFMVLPIAMVGDIFNIFVEDGKASFQKVALVLPVSLKKRLLARYLTIYTLLGIGILVEVLIAFLLSCLTDLMSFSEFFGIILFLSSFMIICNAIFIFFYLLFGYGKEQYAQIVSTAVFFLSVLAVGFEKIKSFLFTSADVENQLSGESELLPMWEAFDFMKEKSWILFFIAIGITILSYVASLLIAEKKKGVF